MSLPPLLAGARRVLLLRLVANGLGQAAAAVATALITRAGFDALIDPSAPPSLWQGLRIGLGLLGAALLGGWLLSVERADAERLGQDYAAELRRLLFAHLTGISPRRLQRRSRGGLMLRFVGDLSALRYWVSIGLVRLLVGGVAGTAALGTLVLLNRPIGLAAAVIIAAGVLVCLRLGPRMREAARRARRRRSQLAANVNEKIAAIAVVQAFGQGAREARRIGRQGDRLAGAMIQRARTAGRLRGVSHGMAAFAAGAVLLVGAGETAAGRASPGTLVAAMLVAALLAPRLKDLGRVYETWNAALVSRQKIEAFLSVPAECADTAVLPDLPRGPGALVFADVSLAGTLHGITARAEAGSRVAIMGPNGAGKSTLLMLATRLLRPTGGRILLDGHDIAAHGLASVRDAVALVGPDLPLLRGSIERNLRYGRRDASDEAVAAVAALCGIDRLLARLPAGDRTRVLEGGLSLSAGQRQCVALGRALLRDPVLLLLDEADANLDPLARGAIDRVLASFKGTVLMITHDRQRVATADRVWCLADGRLVEQGPPAVLLRGSGPTARLFGASGRTAA